MPEIRVKHNEVSPHPEHTGPMESTPVRVAEWIHLGAIALLGLTTLLFTSVNLRFFLHEGVDSAAETRLSLTLMALALVIATGVVAITSYVVKVVKSQAEAKLEMERLRGKANLADSLREMRHDFDNQLTVVLALLQMGRIEGAVDYLQGIVGRKPYLLESGSAETLYAFLVEKGLEAVERRIGISFDLTPCQLPEIPIEVITRIAGNLFDNAVEAASHVPDGGQVKVTMSVLDDHWSFQVWNNGATIPPAMIERIFESGVTTKRDSEGHGLGLAVVRRLVDLHQGTIRVESDPRHGTTFHLSFSLSPAYATLTHNR